MTLHLHHDLRHLLRPRRPVRPPWRTSTAPATTRWSPEPALQGSHRGYAVPDPVKYVFLGPLIVGPVRGRLLSVDRPDGGAKWSLVSGIDPSPDHLHHPGAHPDYTSAAALRGDFNQFLGGTLRDLPLLGIGNASTLSPDADDLRASPGRWRHPAGPQLIAAFGPFFFGVGVNLLGPVVAFYRIGVVWAISVHRDRLMRYARPGRPSPAEPDDGKSRWRRARSVARVSVTGSSRSIAAGSHACVAEGSGEPVGCQPKMVIVCRGDRDRLAGGSEKTVACEWAYRGGRHRCAPRTTTPDCRMPPGRPASRSSR